MAQSTQLQFTTNNPHITIEVTSDPTMGFKSAIIKQTFEKASTVLEHHISNVTSLTMKVQNVTHDANMAQTIPFDEVRGLQIMNGSTQHQLLTKAQASAADIFVGEITPTTFIRDGDKKVPLKTVRGIIFKI